MNLNVTFEIASKEAFEDVAELGALGGCSDYGKEYGLNGYQVDFSVIVNKNSETRTFYICYQSENRNNGMMNYAGWEMSLNDGSCDDDSNELEQFLDCETEVIHSALKDEAEEMAWSHFNFLKEQFFINLGFPEKIESLSELLEFLDALQSVERKIEMGDMGDWIIYHLADKYDLKVINGSIDKGRLPTFGVNEPKH